MGETRVDLRRLLEDLRDAYPGSVEETILTEIVANSLDSGARRIVFRADPANATLTATDDGSGMQRRDLARYHDLATSTKTRGAGIGFAGVGIKLGLLVCEEVITETRRGKSHCATTWSLSSRHKASWKWLPSQPGLVPERGTAVRLRLTDPLSPLLDAGFVEAALRQHFEPLLDPSLDEMLGSLYGHAIELEVNGQILGREPGHGAERAFLSVRMKGKRKPSAMGWLVREPVPLPEERRGVAVSTYGKVIKRGWDWLGVTPANRDCIGGLIEVPARWQSLQRIPALVGAHGDVDTSGNFSFGGIKIEERCNDRLCLLDQLQEVGELRCGEDGEQLLAEIFSATRSKRSLPYVSSEGSPATSGVEGASVPRRVRRPQQLKCAVVREHRVGPLMNADYGSITNCSCMLFDTTSHPISHPCGFVVRLMA